MQNWARSFSFSTSEIRRPTTIAEVQQIVSRGQRVKALGTAHSFNRIADTTGALISVADLPQRFELDPARGEVTVSAGMRYGDLGLLLNDAGYALANMASLPHISVGGAIVTATHGSGMTSGNLATAVTALQLVTAEGDCVELDRSHPDFDGCVVSLGALGVVTAVTLRIEPAFQVGQWIYHRMPRAALEESLDEILAIAYSVSIFVDWRSPSVQVWRKHRLDEPHLDRAPAEWLGATVLERPTLSNDSGVPDNLTEHFGDPGPWHLRLPHFRMEYTPSHGEELQSEYLLPREHALDAITAIESLRDRIAPLVMISEIRTVAADELWMSPSYRRDTVACHFTWRQDIRGVTSVLEPLEQALEPFSARPHWGKLFHLGHEALATLYPRYHDFVSLVDRYDPTGKLRNPTIDRWFPRW